MMKQIPSPPALSRLRERGLIFALALLLLTGCATVPDVVKVPIPIPCPPPPVIERPRLAIRNLTPDTPPAEVQRAYLSSLEQLAGYAKELEALLDGYRKEASRGGSY